MARKKIIAGNWKMNMTPSQAVELVNTLKPLVVNDEVDVVFCVPAIDIIPAMEASKGTNIQIGAENMYFEDKGAYTGEIAPGMLTDVGVKYVIIGHSERREYFAETDETVNKKVLKAFEYGITPIICCGESLTQREQGITIDWIRQQIKIAFLHVRQSRRQRRLLLMSLSGPSAQARWLPPSRRRRFARPSVTALPRSMTRRLRRPSVPSWCPVWWVCVCFQRSRVVRAARYRRRTGGRRVSEAGFRANREL